MRVLISFGCFIGRYPLQVASAHVRWMQCNMMVLCGLHVTVNLALFHLYFASIVARQLGK